MKSQIEHHLLYEALLIPPSSMLPLAWVIPHLQHSIPLYCDYLLAGLSPPLDSKLRQRKGLTYLP